ncbi:MAG TPA: carbohydrate kinase [Polyangiaceae bacterium]|nr:carbohydrate kinase [Polyangiaceae bacterium]
MLDVVCFGEILWDVFETRPRGREAIAREFRRELGGAPANVATGLARLGVRSAILGAVGRDRFGDALLAHLRSDGVDTRFVARLPNRTGLTFVVRDDRGEPEFLFYRHASADLCLRADHVRPAAGRARWALVGTSTMMTPELAAATAKFLVAARDGGARIFVDLNVRPHLWSDRRAMRDAIARLVAAAAIVKASDADLRAVGGGLRWLRGHAPRATWLVTRGGGMASAIGAHGEVNEPALRARCVDATGAGDAFIAGALAMVIASRAVPGSAAWLDGSVWNAALRVGHRMGKKAVSRAGAVAGLIALGRERALVASARRRSS